MGIVRLTEEKLLKGNDNEFCHIFMIRSECICGKFPIEQDNIAFISRTTLYYSTQQSNIITNFLRCVFMSKSAVHT